MAGSDTADAGMPSKPKPPRPTACTECHTAHVKCDMSSPCSRCVRLGKKCLPHVSRQGQGRKKRRRNTDDGTISSKGANKQSRPHPKFRSRSPKPSTTEDCLGSSATSLRPEHFGLRYLIRGWVSFAIRRRSFSLLAKASTLAARVGVTMDSILCGEGESRLAPPTMLPPEMVGPMDHLLPALLKPARHQELGSSRLRWSELPPDLLSATGCCAAKIGGGAAIGCQGKGKEEIEVCQNIAEVAAVVEEKAEEEILAPILGSRWIWVREMKQGMSRYFVSPAFERDVVSWASIQATWVANEREVVSLFLAPEGKGPWSRALMHQISINERPGTAPRSSRYETKIQIKDTSSSTLTVDVDAVVCLKIIDLDHAFFYVEFLREEVTSAKMLASLASDVPLAASSTAPGQAAQSPVGSVSELNPPLDLDDLSSFDDLDDLMDILASCPLGGSLAE